jgi:hypothetical protein
MDNTTLPTGAGGDTIRTLDKTGTGAPKTEVVALDLGGGDGRSEFIASAPLPVALADVPPDDDGTPTLSLSSATMDQLEILFRQLIAAPYPVTAAEAALGFNSSNLNRSYPSGNVLRYGADPTGNANSAIAIQNAINANVGGQVTIPAGTYSLGSAAVGLTFPTKASGGIRVTGAARNGTILNYNGTGVAIDAFTNGAQNWVIEHLSINISQDAASGIKSGNNSQHQEINDVALFGPQTLTATGAGLLLDAGTPGAFSGNLVAYLFYAEGFKYGVQCIGHSLGLNTWTTMAFHHCYLIGRHAGIVSGSRGIWFDALTNGVGSSFISGTIESFDTALWVDPGGAGLFLSSDIEGNNNQYGGGTVAGTLGNTFAGWIKQTAAVGSSYEQSVNSSANRWYQRQHSLGFLDTETHYAQRHTIYDESAADAQWAIYRGTEAQSFISGTANPTKKFAVNMAVGSSSSNFHHYIYLNGNTIHWDIASPQSVGSGTWAVGDICYNAAPGTSPSEGWVCTVAGTPGTWVPMADQLHGPATVTQPTSGAVALTVNGYLLGSTFAGLTVNTGPLYCSNAANPCIALGSNGTNFGLIQPDSADVWSIATGTNFGALGTAILQWTKAGAVSIKQPSGTNAALTLPAGGTTTQPLQWTSGTNLTTAVAGASEFDGTCLYFSPAASSRAVSPSEYIEVISSAYTLTSQTAAQKLLNATTNGAVTLPVGTYEFECSFSLSSLNTGTSSVFGFALGGAATFTQMWQAMARSGTATTATTLQHTFNTAANVALVSSNTTGLGYAFIKGIIRVTVAGTVIPQVSLNTAAAAVVGTNSYFRAWSVGNGTVTNVGNWS